MAAGTQPISVICKIKQKIPAKGLPMVKKFNHGSNNASNNLIIEPLVFTLAYLANFLD
jgi:hypothetical protein